MRIVITLQSCLLAVLLAVSAGCFYLGSSERIARFEQLIASVSTLNKDSKATLPPAFAALVDKTLESQLAMLESLRKNYQLFRDLGWILMLLAVLQAGIVILTVRAKRRN